MSKGGDDVTIGYKYYLGAHMGIVHGPVDVLSRVRVADKVVWEGCCVEDGIQIEAAGAFGGDSGEGGIEGWMYFENGHPDQPVNPYLQLQLTQETYSDLENIPAFRGVTCAVLEQMYVSAFNPYLKPWAFRMTRTDVTTYGETQWYVEKARIPRSVDSEVGSDNTNDDWITGTWLDGFEGSTEDYPQIGNYLERTDDCLIGSDVPPQLAVGGARYYKTKPVWWDTIASTARDDNIVGPKYARPHEAWWGYNNWVSCTKSGSPGARRRIPASPPDTYGPSRLYVTRTDLPDNAEIWFCPEGYTCVNYQNNPESYGNFKCVLTTELNELEPPPEPPPGPGPDGECLDGEDQGCVDMNPAHIIRECLTDQEWGMGYTADDIDDVAFRAAADTLFNEGMGISILWQRETSIEAFVQDIVRHIDAALYVDRKTGKFVLKLIRDDYVESDLITLNEDNIERIENYRKPAFGDLVNSVTVIYEDCDDGLTAEDYSDPGGFQDCEQHILFTPAPVTVTRSTALAGAIEDTIGRWYKLTNSNDPLLNEYLVEQMQVLVGQEYLTDPDFGGENTTIFAISLIGEDDPEFSFASQNQFLVTWDTPIQFFEYWWFNLDINNDGNERKIICVDDSDYDDWDGTVGGECTTPEGVTVANPINLFSPGSQILIELGSETKSAEITTTNDPDLFGSIEFANTVGTGDITRFAWISRCPGGTPIDANATASGTENTSVRFAQHSKPGYAQLTPGQKYYVNVRNAATIDGATTCAEGDCNVFRIVYLSA